MKSSRFIVASQDRDLQDNLRKKPGQPLLYLHKKTPVLEQPSELSRKTVEFKMTASFNFGDADKKKLSKSIKATSRDKSSIYFSTIDLPFVFQALSKRVKA